MRSATSLPRSFLALGDSYTAGEGVSPQDRWPVLLAALLNDSEQPLSPPVIIARTGWTTTELSVGLRQAAPDGPVDLVTVLIGVNDQFRGHTADRYRTDLRSLLDAAAALCPRGPSIVLSIPDWSVTPFAEGRDRAGIAREIDAFNKVSHEEAARVRATWIDITVSSRRAANDPSLLTSDGLHPSRAMYQDWAKLVADRLEVRPLNA